MFYFNEGPSLLVNFSWMNWCIGLLSDSVSWWLKAEGVDVSDYWVTLLAGDLKPKALMFQFNELTVNGWLLVCGCRSYKSCWKEEENT